MLRTRWITVKAAGLVCLVSHGLPESALSATLRVPSEYATIQNAIDAAVHGDEVLVAPGTYTEFYVRIIEGFPFTACVFMKDGVALRSEGGPEVTTIDGGLIIGYQPAVLYAWGTASLETELEGFTITTTGLPIRGVFLIGALTVRNLHFRSLAVPESSGGGINVNGDVVIEDCVFESCASTLGGAIYHANGTIEMYDSIVRDCGDQGVRLGSNAGLPTESAIIERCVFEDNGDDGALSVSYSFGNVFEIRDSVFRNNLESGTGGAGIGIGGGGPKLIERCLFIGNHSAGGNGGGGGLRTTMPATIRNNVFWMNSSVTGAGGSALEFATGGSLGYELENNVIAAGIGPGGAIQAQFGGVSSSCNVFWQNEGGDGLFFEPGPTDREVDPLFCNPDEEDFTVNVFSPCLPEYSLGCGLIGAFGVGCGTVSIEPQSWGAIKGAYRTSEEDAR